MEHPLIATTNYELPTTNYLEGDLEVMGGLVKLLRSEAVKMEVRQGSTPK